MKIIPFDKVICRTPAFCLNDTLENRLEELKLMIKESSPAFFEFINSTQANGISQLNDKTQFTIWKYFNRAKYRSTPFGSFAAITILPLTFENDSVSIQKQMDKNHYIDWSHKEQHLDNLKHFLDVTTVLLSNASIYFTGDEIRYIRINENNHELAAVNAIPELIAILITCKSKTTCNVIYELMQVSFEMNTNETIDLLSQLIKMQLLSTEKFPNITGVDYFERLGINTPKSVGDYIIAKRKHIKGSFNGDYIKHLPKLVSFLNVHLTRYENGDLNLFKQLFIKRFENQEISLAVIMDPEIGIGYGNLAHHHGANQLISEIKEARANQRQETIEYGEFQAFLLNKIIEGLPFTLEDFKTNEFQKSTLLPNTFSFIFHLYRSLPVISLAGGSTANALLGRFTMGNRKMENHGKEIAAFEIEANKDVIFFDIAYQAEKRIDNVNRRKILYPYELPILTWSDLPEPLDFTDIMVSIHGNEVILKSEKLGKRIIPRIPSAYNHTRSDLAAYRFLCDIQNQNLRTSLSFNLQELFPKLQYYPRVSYKGIIVSPAMWKVPSTIYAQNLSSSIILLKEWLEIAEINFRFKAGYADHTLCFDPNESQDLWAFISYCKQQPDSVYITEALIEASDCIKDEHGGLYFPQYIANFKCDQQLYQALAPPIKTSSLHDRVKLPGGEWLYFELYCHSSKSNLLLLKRIKPFLKTYKNQMKQWFFIRYNEPSNHIRLRLRLKDTNFGFEIITALKGIIEPEMQIGSLIDLKIKTYFRETERYGIKKIDLIERFFYADSKYIIYLLGKVSSENQLIASCLELLLTWLENCFSSLADKMLFVEQMANNFAAETVIRPDHFKKINTNFNALRQDIKKLSIKIPLHYFNNYKTLMKLIMKASTLQNERNKLLADLIHMHINRLFSVDQRMYETIIYHYLLRMLQIERAISKIQ